MYILYIQRPDVVKDRARFKEEMDSLKSKINHVNPITLEEVPKKDIFTGNTPFQKKKAGSILTVQKHGYYDHNQFLADCEKCHEIIKIKTGLNCAFITDHSPIHNFMAEDSLNAKKMNKGSGGKQPKMRNTQYERDGLVIKQSMVFEEGPLKGEAKGLKVVLTERYGEEFTQGKFLDELVDIMSKEEDFKNEKTLLEKQCEKRGDIVIKGVKFHPELMAIESGYRNISNYMRRLNTPGSARGYIERIESSYENSGLTIEIIRKYFRSCDNYLLAYSEGATGDNINQVVKEKRKHRGPGAMLEEEKQITAYNRKRKFNIPEKE